MTIPNRFSAGQTIIAADVMENFDYIEAVIWALTEANLDASCSIPDTKLATITTAGKVNGSAIVDETIEIKTQIIWNIVGTLIVATAANNGTFIFRAPCPMTITGTYMEVKVCPTVSGAVTIDIKKNGVAAGDTIYTVAPSITYGNYTSTSGTLKTDGKQLLVADDYLKLDVTAIGGTVAGADLTVSLRVTIKVPAA